MTGDPAVLQHAPSLISVLLVKPIRPVSYEEQNVANQNHSQ